MRKYQVYGLGNALVDIEFEVTNEFLANNDIEKGLMTLLDEQQHITRLDKLTTEYDLIKRVGGGSAANSIVAVAQFGGQAFYACKIGNDEMGDFYADNLKQAGVNVRINELERSGQTGKCMVMVTPDAERTMNTYLGITADLSQNELFLEELAQADLLYIEGYLVTSETAKAAIQQAKKEAIKHNCKIAMTFSDPAMVKYFKDGLTELLGNEKIDLLFCNEEEAMVYTETDNVDKAAQILLGKAKQIAITRGANGASVYTETSTTHVASPTVTAIDTNGAGDMFAGAFLYGLSQGWETEKSAKLACAAAAEVVTQFGPRISAAAQQKLLSQL